MTELKNKFSWPKTRDEVFKTCLRQNWFTYYGYWNGWLENAPERARQIYVLKNLEDRHMWVGMSRDLRRHYGGRNETE